MEDKIVREILLIKYSKYLSTKKSILMKGFRGIKYNQ